MIDFVNELRESCLEGFTGIVQGLKGDDDKNISRKYLLLRYCEFIRLAYSNIQIC